jgi:hypothetical protein
MAQKKVPAGRNHTAKRGRGRMRELGYRRVEIWLDHDECRSIDNAARKDGKRLATWMREMCLLLSQDMQYRKP